VTFSNTFNCLKSALRVSGLLILLVASAFILNRFLGVSRLTFAITDFVSGLGVSRYVVLAIVLIIYIVLGMFFDIMAMLVLTLPLLFPVMTGLGFDPIWYGVMMCRMSEMGFISPPFGFNLFALQGSLNLSLNTLYRGVIPFLIADIFHVILLVAVPEISTYLPGIMK
jgi:C4-dicarboxylate transporter DctM subunit